jgi:HNH endonuclease
MQNDYQSIIDYYVHKLEERFWKKVEKTDGCWLWKGARAHGGRMQYGNFPCCGKLFSAHRISWILANKEIPKNLHVLHKCDVPLCVRPDHLFLGTNLDNINDKISKGRHGFGETAGRAILTTKQVIEIRNAKLSKSGPDKLTDQMLADKYGVSRRNIRSIRWRQTWRHIPPTS